MAAAQARVCVCFSWPQTMPGAVPTASSCSRAALSSASGRCRMCSYCISRGSDRYFSFIYTLCKWKVKAKCTLIIKSILCLSFNKPTCTTNTTIPQSCFVNADSLVSVSCAAFQEGDRRVKMQNMVRFPLMGMDMAPHVVKRSQSSWSLPSHWSPWRRPYGLGRNPDDYLYDLYAVCNHHGNMHGGHYTGNAKS